MHRLRVLIPLCSAALLVGLLSAQEPVFSRIDANRGPAAREFHAMVFLPHTGTSLMFGGWDRAAIFSDTWEFRKDSGWVHRTPATVPPARYWHSMSYDSTRRVVVMFGGIGNNGDLNDTWEWDGSDWHQVVVATPPPPRANFALGYHVPTRRTVLYGGGLNGGNSAIDRTDTWTYDGQQWQQEQVAPPATPPGAPSPNVVPNDPLLIAGAQGDLTLAATFAYGIATWRWNGTGWIAPMFRFNGLYGNNERRSGFETPWGVMIHDINGLILLPHGGGYSFIGTQPTLHGVDFSLSSAATTFDSQTRSLAIYGGYRFLGPFPYSTALSADTLVYSIPDLTSTPLGQTHGNPTRPAGRTYFAFADQGGADLMFGGIAASVPLDDTWLFDGSIWVRRTPIVHPPARVGARAVYMPSVQSALLYGGYANGNYTGAQPDYWNWNGSVWSVYLQLGPQPGPRAMHTMIFDPVRNRVLLFGGHDGTTALGDTWEFNPVAMQWSPRAPINSPPARTSHSMVYDSRRNRSVMFGGSDAAGLFLGDTWEYDGGNWSQRAPVTNPPRRWSQAMAYDPARGLSVMTGGYGDPQCGNYCARLLDDVWEWNGADWRERAPACERPVPRQGAGLAFDQRQSQLVMFGGSDTGNQVPGDTWLYSERTDVPGPGMATGTRRSLRITKAPAAGGYEPLTLEFDNPIGVGFMILSLAPLQSPTLPALVHPQLCGQANLYQFAFTNLIVTGNPSRFAVGLPAWTKGVGLCFQGVCFENSGCLALTDPLVVVPN